MRLKDAQGSGVRNRVRVASAQSRPEINLAVGCQAFECRENDTLLQPPTASSTAESNQWVSRVPTPKACSAWLADTMP